MYFHHFLITSPWKRARPFIWKNLNPLYPRMISAKFGWNWPSGSWEEVKNRKSLQMDGQMDRLTDNKSSEKLTWPFSSGELKRWVGKGCSMQGMRLIFGFTCRLHSIYINYDVVLQHSGSAASCWCYRHCVCILVRGQGHHLYIRVHDN